jgi:hypothetical protein
MGMFSKSMATIFALWILAFTTPPVCSILLTKPLPMSRWLILQQARHQRSLSPPTAWELSTVSCSISLPTGGSFDLMEALRGSCHPHEQNPRLAITLLLFLRCRAWNWALSCFGFL